MKNKYLLLLYPVALFLFACNKGLDVETPSFNVAGFDVTNELDSMGSPVKKVTFKLEGYADVISFFSGETLHDYAYKDGRILKTDGLNMSFEYLASVGAGTDPKWEQLSVQASSDFNGNMDEDGINSATWTNITDRFSIPMATDINSRTTTSADISDLAVENKPLYIAFKYVTPPRTISSAYTTWDIFDFNVSQETILGTTTILSQSEAALPLYYAGPNDADIPGRSARTVSTTSRLRFRANILAQHLGETAEVWAMSPPIVVTKDADLGPDRPISIKTRIDPALTTFTYSYSEPGTYKVAFVASNVTTKAEQQTVKELEIVIP